MTDITYQQLRAARAVLRISQSELAARAGVDIRTVQRAEAPPRGNSRRPAITDARLKIAKALRHSGFDPERVVFKARK